MSDLFRPKDGKKGLVRLLKKKRLGDVDISDYFVFSNIECVDRKGNLIERYNAVGIAKDIVRTSIVGASFALPGEFSPYEAIDHFDDRGFSLPSFALTCNLLKALYNHKDKIEVSKTLYQYKNYGLGHGWHIQNTIVDWDFRKVIHYPCDEDFEDFSEEKEINVSKQRYMTKITPIGFRGMKLEDALKKTFFTNFLKDLTGLEDPGFLVDFAGYVGKEAWVSVPDECRWAEQTTATWLGCMGDRFCINTGTSLGIKNAARKVVY